MTLTNQQNQAASQEPVRLVPCSVPTKPVEPVVYEPNAEGNMDGSKPMACMRPVMK